MGKSIAIIPARGGSKRIPKKNINLFLGKPIIAYSIQAAIDSNLFDEIMVSTDSLEIAEISKEYGANVPFLRSEKNADDNATTFSVLKEVLSMYQGFTYAACIYPTAPLISVEKLKEAKKRLKETSFDSVFTTVKYGHPIQRALHVDEITGRVEMLKDENLNLRSQDLTDTYHDAGQFYFFKIDPIMHANRLWTVNSGGLILDELEAQDIDTATDWKLAELKYKLRNEVSKQV